MKTSKIERTARYFDSMSKLGFSYSEAQSLRRIELTLQRWSERECGDGNEWGSWAIERDEDTNKPYLVHHHYRHGRGSDSITATLIPDREKGALDRLAKIMAKHPELWSYHQTDPRGCALYIGQREGMTPLQIEQIDRHYTRGIAVCI